MSMVSDSSPADAGYRFADWGELFETRARLQKPLYRFLITGDTEAKVLSYQDLLEQAGSLARQLSSRYRPGTHLLLLFEPGLDFCLAFWACLLSGMVAVPAYPPADARMRERFMALARDAGCKGVLTTQHLKGLVTLARWLVPAMRKLEWLAIDSLPRLSGDLPSTPGPEALALLQYTSGSTGTPRGVMLSHGNLWHNMLCLEGARSSAGPRHSQTDDMVSWLPLYHDMGLMTGVIFPLFLGCTSTLFSPLHFLQKPARWLKVMSETRAHISAAPNFAYEFCLRRIKDAQIEGIDLSHWAGSLNGAEVIRPSTVREFLERFAPYGLAATFFYPCYGLAESTVFVTGCQREADPVIKAFSRSELQQHRVLPLPETSADADDVQELVSAGSPFCETRIAVVDPETLQRTEPDRVGEIWLNSGSVGQGYWQQPEATEEAFKARLDGQDWLRTGDLGFVYEGGLYLTGRIKDLIILQGQNHAPHSFESVAEAAHEAIRTGCVAAFGAGDPEGLVLVIEIKPGSKATADAIQSQVREAIAASHAVPVSDIRLVVKGSIPKTTSGKLRRRNCRELYLNHKLKPWKPGK